ncbi:hypothetical protein C0991_011846 [Blastosporella zonata]|nr:hypothetical protein C0991_011846 [Blastosporella zonata]
MSFMPTLVDNPQFSLLKVPIKKVKELEITHDTFADFDHARPIGISPGYSSDGKMIALAISDDKGCTLIEFNTPMSTHGRSDRGRQSRNRDKSPLLRNLDGLNEKILCRQAGELFAFDMGPLCLSIYTDAKLRVTNAVDIQSGLSAVDRRPLTAIKEILGTSAESITIKDKNIVSVFSNPVYDHGDRKSSTDLAQRAWISQLLAVYGNGELILSKVPRIDTQKLMSQKLDTLAKNTNDTLRQNLNKPMKTKHDAEIIMNGKEPATVVSTRFTNKLRNHSNLVMVTENGSGGRYLTRGQVGFVSGKSGPLLPDRSLDGKTVTSIISIGRDDPTTAEAQRAATVLKVLQGYGQLMDDSPWIQNIFYPTDNHHNLLLWPLAWSQTDDPSTKLNNISTPPSDLLCLNSSQQDAVNTMCSPHDNHRIKIIQGPPGTGKTSVIASFVQLAIHFGYDGIWLVAQSNVAVKNIAEKLMKTGFQDWRLLVSKDFMFEWHEHLYSKALQENVIRSDRFKFINPNHLKGCKVMLCTLSMLSNPHISNFTSQNPIKTLVIDEASQIEVNNYVSVLVTSTKLRKMCFIGDDNQLPPFGQEDLQDLQSIFEVPHLSQEEKNGDSFMNILECDSIIKLAQQLQEQQKAYQIITPYEGQRSTIETKMKTSGLNWENKCFNNLKVLLQEMKKIT